MEPSKCTFQVEDEDCKVLTRIVNVILSKLSSSEFKLLENHVRICGFKNPISVVEVFIRFGAKEALTHPRKSSDKKITKRFKEFIQDIPRISIFESYRQAYIGNVDYSEVEHPRKRRKVGENVLCPGKLFHSLDSIKYITNHQYILVCSRNNVVGIYEEIVDEIEFGLYLHDNELEDGEDDIYIYRVFHVDCRKTKESQKDCCLNCDRFPRNILRRIKCEKENIDDRLKSLRILTHYGTGQNYFHSDLTLMKMRIAHDFVRTSLDTKKFPNIVGIEKRSDQKFAFKFLKKYHGGRKKSRAKRSVFSEEELVDRAEIDAVEYDEKCLVAALRNLLDFLSEEYSHLSKERIEKRLSASYCNTSPFSTLDNVLNYLFYSLSVNLSCAQIARGQRIGLASYPMLRNEMKKIEMTLAAEGKILLFGSTGVYSPIAKVRNVVTTKKSIVTNSLVCMNNFRSQRVFLESHVNPDRSSFINSVLNKYIIRNIIFDSETGCLYVTSPVQISFDATQKAESVKTDSDHNDIKKLDVGFFNRIDCVNPLDFNCNIPFYVNLGEAKYRDWASFGPSLRNDILEMYQTTTNVNVTSKESNGLLDMLKLLNIGTDNSVVRSIETTIEPVLCSDLPGIANFSDPSGQKVDSRTDYNSVIRFTMFSGILDADKTESAFLELYLYTHPFYQLIGYGSSDDYDEENEYIYVRGKFPWSSSSRLLGLSPQRNIKYCYLHIIGSVLRYGQKFHRDYVSFLGKLLFGSKSSSESRIIFEEQCLLWLVEAGLITKIEGSDLDYKDYKYTEKSILDSFERRIRAIISQIGSSDVFLHPDHHSIYAKQVIKIGELCRRLADVTVLSGQERISLLESFDYYVVIVDRNHLFVDSISHYLASMAAVLGLDIGVSASLIMRQDSHENANSNTRENDRTTSGLIKGFGQTNTKFHSFGDSSGSLYEVSTANNYCLQQLRKLSFQMKIEHNLYTSRSDREVMMNRKNVQFSEPESIIIRDSPFRDDHSIKNQKYKEHISHLRSFFDELSEYNRKKEKVINDYHIISIDSRKFGYVIPQSLSDWFSDDQNRADLSLWNDHQRGMNSTAVWSCGAGKFSLGANHAIRICHSHDDVSVWYLTTESCKHQGVGDFQTLIDSHQYVRPSISTIGTKPGIRIIHQLARSGKRIIIPSYSNLSGIVKSIKKLRETGHQAGKDWERILAYSSKFILDEGDKVFAKAENDNYKALLELLRMCSELREIFRARRLNDIKKYNTSNLSEVCPHDASLVLMTATPFNGVDDALLNAFVLMNRLDRGTSAVIQFSEKLCFLKNIFKKHNSAQVLENHDLLKKIDSTCDVINRIIFQKWSNLDVVSPDNVSKSECSVNKFVLFVKLSKRQEEVYEEYLKKKHRLGELRKLGGVRTKSFIENSSRMVLDMVAAKLFDDPNVWLEEMLDEESMFEQQFDVEDNPHMWLLQILSSIYMRKRLKMIYVSRSVGVVRNSVEYIKMGPRDFYTRKSMENKVFHADGTVSSRERELQFEGFKTVESPASLSTTFEVYQKGLNLQCGDVVVQSGCHFNPSKEFQKDCRTDRQGRKSNLLQFQIVSGSTVQSEVFFRCILKQYMMMRIFYRCDINLPDISSSRVNVDAFIKDVLKFGNEWESGTVESEMLKKFSQLYISDILDYKMIFNVKNVDEMEDE